MNLDGLYGAAGMTLPDTRLRASMQ
jgi:hypothetical protein